MGESVIDFLKWDKYLSDAKNNYSYVLYSKYEVFMRKNTTTNNHVWFPIPSNFNGQGLS